MDINFQATERKWQAAWRDAKLFEPKAESEREKFFFTIPYPYVTGNLHVGHGRTYTNGDVIARFKRMQGYNVLWPMAFHITGTPVLAVSSKIAKKDPGTLELYRGYVRAYEPDEATVERVVASFADPWSLVNYFSKKLVQDFTSMGYSLDLSRQFTTGDKEYNKFVEWQFHQYQHKGYLTQAAYPLLYCVNDKNAVGEDDIKDADTQPVEVQKFYAFKFAVPSGPQAGKKLVSATLRADTAWGVTNVFVQPDWEYAVAQVEEGGRTEEWIVSAQALEKLSLQNRKVKQTGTVRGADLVGLSVKTPVGASVSVLPAAFIEQTVGTGIVHSVPAHAPFDFVALQDLQKDSKMLERFAVVNLKQLVEQIKPIGVIQTPGFGEIPAAELVQKLKINNAREKDKLNKATAELYKAEFYGGRMNERCGEFAGTPSSEGKEKVGEWLTKQGAASVFYETSRAAECRCGGQVVAAVMKDQWFIDFSAPGWKERSRECLERMLIVPKQYKKQFEDVFAWLDKRPAARRRGLGTQLPFNNEWIIESLSDSTLYMAFYTIIKPLREHGVRPEQLSPAFFDYVFNGKQSAKKTSEETGVPAAALDAIRREFLYWYPNDLRHTGTAHITNHLSFFIFAHTAAFGPEHWPRAISLNELVISEGAKMSKSKGNVVTLYDIKKDYPVDAYRLYSVGAAELGGVLDFRRKDVDATRRTVQRLANAIEDLRELTKQPAQSGPAAAWFVSKFERAARDATTALDEFRLRDYVQITVHGLLKHYDYFKRRATPAEQAHAAKQIGSRWVALICPVVPHVAEELWQRAGGNGFASAASWPENRLQFISDDAERGEDFVAGAIEDARKILELLQRKNQNVSRVKFIIAKPEKARLLTAALEKAATPEELDALLGGEASANLLEFAKKNFFELKNRGTAEFDEIALLQDAKGFLERELGLAVTIESEAQSTEPRAARALPGRPAVLCV